MDIYKDELDIAEKIIASQSVACISEIEALDIKDIPFAFASIYSDTPNTADLFYTKSILVSTNLNKNDDYFDPSEVWASRKTPVDKPMDIEHDHARIVGHITASWAVDKTNNILAEDISEIPDFFHLCNAAVIYKRWQSEALQAQVDDLIDDIKEGKYFVSMEAHFSSFDYLLEKNGKNHILAREDKTSFLTKKLRCYGGDGMYDGCKVGRVLRNIVFSGCGYVKRPANPESIILSAEKTIKNVTKSFNNGVYVKCSEENHMSDVLVEKQVAELKEALKEAQAENKSLTDKLASASTEKLEAENASLRQQLTEAQEHAEEMKKKKKQMEEGCATLTQELENVKAEYAKAKQDLEAIRVEAIKASRIRQLQDAGLNADEAKAKAESLIGLSNEQFDAVASALALVKPAKVEGSEEDEKAAQASAELNSSEEESEGVDETASDSNDIDELMAAVAARYDEQLSKENK